jgi:hypothetical protein
MVTSPALSEITVLARTPLREFSPSRPAGSCFSYPRCSVISSSSAVSSTVFVNSFNSPSGPVMSNPRSLADFTISRIAARSAAAGWTVVLSMRLARELIPGIVPAITGPSRLTRVSHSASYTVPGKDPAYEGKPTLLIARHTGHHVTAASTTERLPAATASPAHSRRPAPNRGHLQSYRAGARPCSTRPRRRTVAHGVIVFPSDLDQTYMTTTWLPLVPC